MDKFLGQDIPEKERWQFLKDNADAMYKNKVIDEQIEAIKGIAPEIVVIEV